MTDVGLPIIISWLMTLL